MIRYKDLIQNFMVHFEDTRTFSVYPGLNIMFSEFILLNYAQLDNSGCGDKCHVACVALLNRHIKNKTLC